jgi:phytoene/squalene synthetase
MAAFGVTEAHLAERRNDAATRALMTMQVERAQAMLVQGAGLGRRLRGRFGLEIRVITQGGLRVAERLLALDDVYARPRLSRRDGLKILARGLLA